jgi:hypothetical protein
MSERPELDPTELDSRLIPAVTIVTVEWGNEHFAPLPYHGVDTGTFRVSAPLLDGETLASATGRLWKELNSVAIKIRAAKLASYLAEVENVAVKVNAVKR